MSESLEEKEIWMKHLEKIKKLKIPMAEYGRKHNISVHSLYGWKKRLKDEKIEKFVKVKTAPYVIPEDPAPAVKDELSKKPLTSSDPNVNIFIFVNQGIPHNLLQDILALKRQA